MKRIAMGMLMMAVSASAFAGDAENIAACVRKAKEFSGVILDEFNVNYEGNWLSMSIAKWSNAQCEVKVGEVYKLVVNGELLVFDGFAGKGSYELNEALQEKTNSAINTLNSRIALLRQRMKEVPLLLYVGTSIAQTNDNSLQQPAAGAITALAAGAAGNIGGRLVTRKILVAVKPDLIHKPEDQMVSDAQKNIEDSIRRLQNEARKDNAVSGSIS
ncbi:MAG: hypothetical protein Q7J38_06235 [Gallionella sp.]|nr:hypothetical protein [Gallionella sp.]